MTEMTVDTPELSMQKLLDAFCYVTYCKANGKPYKDSIAYCQILDRGCELHNFEEVQVKHRKAQMQVVVCETLYPELKNKNI
jgi:hypothetical protein